MPRPQRPNIIHLISHDMGQYLGCHSHRIATPNYDRIAAMGTRFENCFCTAAQCSPSRGSIMTGLYPHNNGLIGLSHIGWSINDGVRRLPEYLNELGYETCLIGGHHEAPIQPQEDAASRRAAVASLGYRQFIDTADITPVPKYNYIGACYRKLEENLDRFCQANAPFFINIGTPGAHREYSDNRYGILFEPDDPRQVEVPPYLPDCEPIRHDLACLHGLIKREDEYVGRIFGLLESRGLLENTLLVLTTDHGVAMPGAKGTCYDPGLGTFLILYMKGRFEGGAVRRELISNVDLLPTYIELAGGTPPATLDGRSFLPLLEGRPYQKRDHVFAEMTWHDQYNPMRAVRTERLKYVRNFGKRPKVYLPLDVFMGRAGPAVFEDCYYYCREEEELYDLTQDRWEQRNVVADAAYSQDAARLRALVNDWMRDTNDPLLAGDVPPSPEQHRQLTARNRYNNG